MDAHTRTRTAGPDVVNERIGVNATGQKFNSILAIDLLKNIPSDEKHVIPAREPAQPRVLSAPRTSFGFFGMTRFPAWEPQLTRASSATATFT